MTEVGVIVPTKDSAETIVECLRSLRRQTHPCKIVVVDNFSTDATVALATPLADVVVLCGPERSAQRNAGAALAATPIVGFIDSDMVVGPEVVAQVVGALTGPFGACIVPERSVGDGYWAHVRAFERSFYVGSDAESARFFTATILGQTGGFDESLDAGEDWDLTIRARALTETSRIAEFIDHQEGRVRYRIACAKKASYALGIRRFQAKHGGQALVRILDRPYLRRPWNLAVPHPFLGIGVVALKVGEAAAVARALRGNRAAGDVVPPGAVGT